MPVGPRPRTAHLAMGRLTPYAGRMALKDCAPREWAFPMECLACGALKGHPFRAETLANMSGSIRVSLRCQECRHEWCADLIADPHPAPPPAATVTGK